MGLCSSCMCVLRQIHSMVINFVSHILLPSNIILVSLGLLSCLWVRHWQMNLVLREYLEMLCCIYKNPMYFLRAFMYAVSPFASWWLSFCRTSHLSLSGSSGDFYPVCLSLCHVYLFRSSMLVSHWILFLWMLLFDFSTFKPIVKMSVIIVECFHSMSHHFWSFVS